MKNTSNMEDNWTSNCFKRKIQLREALLSTENEVQLWPLCLRTESHVKTNKQKRNYQEIMIILKMAQNGEKSFSM